VPEKTFLSPDSVDSKGIYSTRGQFENTLVAHIKCELEKGLWLVKLKEIPYVPWLYGKDWGTAVNLTIQVDELSALNPTVSVVNPLENAVKVFPFGGNVISSQLFSLGIGASATAHATRTETIQYTYSNYELLREADDPVNGFNTRPETLACDTGLNGIQIQSDLKIDWFIYDKASIAAHGNERSTKRDWAPYSLFQDQITFVASYGGNVTPAWRFERTTVNQNTTLLNATRSDTDTLIITMGQIDTTNLPTPSSPLQLKGAAQQQHNNAAAAVAISGSSSAATH
jgi:hypothetical protein